MDEKIKVGLQILKSSINNTVSHPLDVEREKQTARAIYKLQAWVDTNEIREYMNELKFNDRSIDNMVERIEKLKVGGTFRGGDMTDENYNNKIDLWTEHANKGGYKE